jgi:DNA-binding IclR family transcriptional regulator
VLEILQFLAGRPAPVPSMVIARELGFPRSSTYHLLNVLKDRGWVVYYADDRRWGLGSAVVPLAAAYRRTFPLALVARPLLEGLATQLDAWTFVAQFVHGRLVRSAEARPGWSGPSRNASDWADTPHAHAAGRALLSGLDRDAVLRLCGGRTPLSWPGSGPIRLNDLLAHVESERAAGVHVDRFGPLGGPVVAVSVWMGRGPAVAAVGVGLTADVAAPDNIGRHVAEAASALSERLTAPHAPKRTDACGAGMLVAA